MGVVTVNIPKRLRSPRAPLPEATAREALEKILRGEAIAPDDLTFEERRLAQTEAWRWRHQLADMGHVDAESLRSSTWSPDGGETWRFAVYYDGAVPQVAAGAG